MNKVITGKVMEEKLKRGYTIAYFASYFNVTEEEFLSNLEKTFSKKACKGYLARLKKNGKVHHKSELSVDASEKVEECNSETENNSIVEETDNTSAVNCPTNDVSKLDELTLEKEKFQSILNHLEIEHKELCSERFQIRRSIFWYKEKLDELKAEIVQCKNELSSLLFDLDTKLDVMHELNASISETREKLSEIDQNIEALQKISVFAYNSGEVELETKNSIEFPEWNELFNSILSDEQADNFTLKQLKTLAKVIALVQKLENENLKYEVIFEDSSLEDFFSKKVNEVITLK